MTATVPTVEVADHRYAPRVRRPHRKVHAFDIIDRHRLSAERAAELAMCAFIDQVQVKLAEQQRSEEHTSELQSLMRISYAVFCLKKNTTNNRTNQSQHT